MNNKQIEDLKSACKTLYEAISEISGNGAPAKSTLDKLSLAANSLRKLEKTLTTIKEVQTPAPTETRKFIPSTRGGGSSQGPSKQEFDEFTKAIEKLLREQQQSLPFIPQPLPTYPTTYPTTWPQQEPWIYTYDTVTSIKKLP